jgi:hypothetical protein
MREDIRTLERLLGERPTLPAWYGQYAKFDEFADAVEQLLGRDITQSYEDLDGSGFESAYDSWLANCTPAEYVAGWRP